MHNRRDHVLAHRFAVSRLAAALATGRPGTGEAPFRRASLGTFLGVAAAVLLCGAAALYGLLDPGASTAWRQSGAIIVEKETGTRFLYLNGVLYPTANYASVLLLAGGTPAIHYVPRSALAAIPEGPAVGIPGAPDSLPPAGALLSGRWALCLPPDHPGEVTLDLAPGSLGAGLGRRRVLVSGPEGGDWVIFGHTRYPLNTRSALVALGFGNTDPLPAPAAWLDALPQGKALAPPAIAGAGRPGPDVAGRPATVGELFDSIAGGMDQRYVLLADGFAPISATEFALFAASRGEGPPAQVSPADIAALPSSADRAMLSMLPDLLSGSVYQSAGSAQPGGEALCVSQASPGDAAGTTVVTANLDTPGVLVPPGAGMIVAAPSAPPGGGSAPTYLITASGEKYLLAGNAQSALGYGNAAAQAMPSQILGLVPACPALSQALARREA